LKIDKVDDSLEKDIVNEDKNEETAPKEETRREKEDN
jgi:hypothetical protein